MITDHSAKIAACKARHDERVAVLLGAGDKMECAEKMRADLIAEGKSEHAAAIIVNEAWRCAKAKAANK